MCQHQTICIYIYYIIFIAELRCYKVASTTKLVSRCNLLNVIERARLVLENKILLKRGSLLWRILTVLHTMYARAVSFVNDIRQTFSYIRRWHVYKFECICACACLCANVLRTLRRLKFRTWHLASGFTRI